MTAEPAPRKPRQSWRAVLWAWGPALLSGLLLAAAQNIKSLGWVVLFCLVPVCLRLRPARLGRTWMALSITIATATALTLTWIRLIAPGSIWLIPLAALYSTIFTGILALSFRFAGSTLALPAAWMVAEIVARRLPFGATWALLGLPLAGMTATSQVASLAGPEALSFAAASINVALAYWWHRRFHWTAAVATLQGPVLMAALTLWGGYRISHTREAPQKLDAGVVQPQISREERSPDKRPVALRRMSRLIDSIAHGADVVILPEAAIAGFVRYEDDLTEFVKSTVGRTHRPLLFGSFDRTQDSSEASIVAILIAPDGDVTTYRKLRLDPVTERTPRIFGLPRPRPNEPDWTPGKEQPIFDLEDGGRFATLISLEDIFPDLARSAVRSGANLLIALIDTAPFTGTAQPMQHLRRAQLTAISAGRPLLRVANTGVTCWIDPNGRVRQALEPGRDGSEGRAAVFEIPLGGPQTIYNIFGDIGPLAIGLILMVAAAVPRWIGEKADSRATSSRLSFRGRGRRSR